MDFRAIDNWIENNSENMLRDLGALIAIPSKRGAAEEGKPFGAACAEALAKARLLAEEAGLQTENLDNYILECNYNDEETALGIIAHLDVVPEGDGWDSPPFELTKKGGAVYGRGAIDDKGPAVAALYALKALKENGVSLEKNVRLLFGSDEESGMSDLKYYRSRRELPKMMLSPDGAFPVINVEKGLCQVSFEKEYAESASRRSLLSFKAGGVINAVPDKAEAVVSGVALNEAAELTAGAGTTLELSFAPYADGVKISAKGRSAHGSTPQKGDNALTGLLKVMRALNLSETELSRSVFSLYELFPYGESYGESAGLAMSDGESGPLTALLSVLNAENGRMSGGIDVRFPASVKLADVEKILRGKLTALGLNLNAHAMEGHIVPAESEFVRTLLNCYTDVTGNEGKCVAESGATYLHEVEGGVAYGAEMPDEENNMHGANEHASIQTLLSVSKIYARAICRLCR